jgi:ATP-dependent protease HslVU (ClpYQ) ATPase subunit
MGQQLRQMFSQLGGAKSQKRTLAIKAARPMLIEDEAGKLVNEEDIRAQAIESCEQNGIVLIRGTSTRRPRWRLSGTPAASSERRGFQSAFFDPPRCMGRATSACSSCSG